MGPWTKSDVALTAIAIIFLIWVIHTW